MKGGVFQVICSQEDWRRRTGGGEGGGRLIIVIYTNLYDTLPCTDPDPTRPLMQISGRRHCHFAASSAGSRHVLQSASRSRPRSSPRCRRVWRDACLPRVCRKRVEVQVVLRPRPVEVPVHARARKAVDVLAARPVVAAPRVVAVGHPRELKVAWARARARAGLSQPTLPSSHPLSPSALAVCLQCPRRARRRTAAHASDRHAAAPG